MVKNKIDFLRFFLSFISLFLFSVLLMDCCDPFVCCFLDYFCHLLLLLLPSFFFFLSFLCFSFGLSFFASFGCINNFIFIFFLIPSIHSFIPLIHSVIRFLRFIPSFSHSFDSFLHSFIPISQNGARRKNSASPPCQDSEVRMYSPVVCTSVWD